MSEFKKTFLMMVLTAIFGAAISSFATVSGLSQNMQSLTKSVDKISLKLDKIDERVRQTEIKQAQYYAAN